MQHQRMGVGGSDILCILVCRPPVRPAVVRRFIARCDISVLRGGILIKLGTNAHHLSGHCQKVLSSEIKGQGHDLTDFCNVNFISLHVWPKKTRPVSKVCH